MAWRLSLSEASSPAPLAKRRNTGDAASSVGAGAVGREDEGDMRDMLINLQKLSLHQQQTLRSVCSGAWTTYKVPNCSECIVRARAAGQAYAAGVAKQRTGHTLGSPHVHVAIAAVEGMVVMGEASQLPEEAAVLKVMTEEMSAKGMAMVDSVFPFFKVVDLSKGSAGRSKRGGGSEVSTPISLVQFQMSPFATPDLVGVNLATPGSRLAAVRDAMDRILLKNGGERDSGTAPPMALERVVQKDIDSLQNRRR